ncbi:NAD(P)-dependent alcohol dehydrogenase [Paenibacillus gansuensis]|uniref:NAD(P)-dependent alcohol dehydrogenase n=1 Tax=Paenibacillus gansuensis TaxID=306542 RepID=A0ABW5PAS3_9BACL
MQIKAAVAREKGQKLSLENLQIDEPRENEVLVRIVAAGICHTDLSVRDQHVPVPLPVVLGHEGSGIVEKIGSRVTKVKPGDKVVLSLGSDGECEKCKAGLPSYCEHHNEYNFAGSRLDGSVSLHHHDEDIHSHFFSQSSFATYSIADESGVVKVEDDAPIEYLGPFACGIMTGAGSIMNTLRPEPGTSIVVFGAGAVGLSAIMAAKVVGCTTIIAVDLKENRLELAKNVGATHVINPSKENMVERVKELTNGKGAHYAFESTGIPHVMSDSFDILAENGSSYITGVTPLGTKLDLDIWGLIKGRSIRGGVMGDAVPSTFIPRLVELFQQGRFPVDKMMRFYRLDEINQAIEDVESGTTVKAVLRMDK